jgi:hypothetical protein
MTIDPVVKQALDNSHFAEKFKALSEKYPYQNESLENYANDKIMEIISQLGYEAGYNKKENFFKIKQPVNGYQVQLNISCKYGIAELIFAVEKNGERLPVGGPWSLVYRLLTGGQERLKYPAFRNYEEAAAIFREAFGIYEAFKAALRTE